MLLAYGLDATGVGVRLRTPPPAPPCRTGGDRSAACVSASRVVRGPGGGPEATRSGWTESSYTPLGFQNTGNVPGTPAPHMPGPPRRDTDSRSRADATQRRGHGTAGESRACARSPVHATGGMLLKRMPLGYTLAPAFVGFQIATGMPILITPVVQTAIGPLRTSPGIVTPLLFTCSRGTARWLN